MATKPIESMIMATFEQQYNTRERATRRALERSNSTYEVVHVARVSYGYDDFTTSEAFQADLLPCDNVLSCVCGIAYKPDTVSIAVCDSQRPKRV